MDVVLGHAIVVRDRVSWANAIVLRDRFSWANAIVLRGI